MTAPQSPTLRGNTQAEIKFKPAHEILVLIYRTDKQTKVRMSLWKVQTCQSLCDPHTLSINEVEDSDQTLDL